MINTSPMNFMTNDLLCHLESGSLISLLDKISIAPISEKICLEAVAIQVGRRQWHTTPVLLPGKSHGQRSLVGYSPWGREESDTTERLHFHFSLSCIGEGMATHSSVLAWRIPGMGEPGGLPSMGSHRVGHKWHNLAAAAAA